MRRSTSILLLGAAMLSTALLAGDEARSQGEPAAAPVSSPTPETTHVLPAAPARAAGMTIYKDPETGRLKPVPPAELRELLSEDLAKATNMSQEGLAQVVAPGGGVMIDLQGRFQSVMSVAVGSDGQVTGHCDTADSEPRKD